MAKILIKNSRVWDGERFYFADVLTEDEGFDLTDKAGNHIVSEKGYRCVLTVTDGEVVYKD